MPIPFRCLQCDATGKAGSRFAGQLIQCPRCKAMVKIADSADAGALTPQPLLEEWPREPLPMPPAAAKSIAIETPPLPPPPPPITNLPAPEKKVAPAPQEEITRSFPKSIYWVVVGLIIAWLATLHTPTGSGVLIHYGAIVAAGLVIGLGFTLLKGPRWMYWAGIVAGIALAVAWGLFDYSVEHWSTEDEHGITREHTDWVYRSGPANPFYREIEFTNPAGDHTIEVSFSESFKKHGRVHHHIFLPKEEYWEALEDAGFEVDGLSAVKDRWYWYDELITEGEWHLRNK